MRSPIRCEKQAERYLAERNWDAAARSYLKAGACAHKKSERTRLNQLAWDVIRKHG